LSLEIILKALNVIYSVMLHDEVLTADNSQEEVGEGGWEGEGEVYKKGGGMP
jgi:hypothetical protein